MADMAAGPIQASIETFGVRKDRVTSMRGVCSGVVWIYCAHLDVGRAGGEKSKVKSAARDASLAMIIILLIDRVKVAMGMLHGPCSMGMGMDWQSSSCSPQFLKELHLIGLSDSGALVQISNTLLIDCVVSKLLFI